MRLDRNRWYPWICLASLLGSQLGALFLIIISLIVFPQYGHWTTTPLGAFLICVMSGVAAIAVVWLFNRPQSLRGLFEASSFLGSKLYYSVSLGLVFGVVGVLVARSEMREAYLTLPLTKPYVSQMNWEKHFLTLLLIAAPAIEEVVMRGFLYRVFRSAYGFCFTLFVVVSVTILSHLSAMTVSAITFIFMLALQITFCVLMEKTGNLWNCIACHASYNVIIALAWVIG